MSIQVVKHINEEQNNRVEYLFVNFDYFDGNDLVAKLFAQEYQMLADEKIDGIYYSIVRLHKDSIKYDLIWHEDVGNYIFSLQQDETSIKELEQRLEIIVSKLNEMIKAWEIIENDDDNIFTHIVHSLILCDSMEREYIEKVYQNVWTESWIAYKRFNKC